MYVVDIKYINEQYDFRISVFKAMEAFEAASWLEADRKRILQHTLVAEEVGNAKTYIVQNNGG